MKQTTELVIPLLDTPNKNGRIYSKECLKQIESQCKNKELLVYCGDDGSNLLEKVSHTATDFKLTERGLECTIKPLSTPEGKKWIKQTFEDEQSCVRPRGVGNITREGHIENYKLQSLTIIPNDIDSFNFDEPNRRKQALDIVNANAERLAEAEKQDRILELKYRRTNLVKELYDIDRELQKLNTSPIQDKLTKEWADDITKQEDEAAIERLNNDIIG